MSLFSWIFPTKKRSFESYLRMDGWTCHICSDYRPDAMISVYSYPIPGFPPGTATRNVRYCNDRPACLEGARERERAGAV